MTRDQCRAYCQCKSCKDGSNNDYNNDSEIAAVAAKSLDKYNDLASTSVDAAYLASLHESLKHTAKAASMRNASKFTPDEQLLSSTRNDKDANAMMSDMVPLRRRDRLQELLILEEKKRLREKAKLRELRRAAGLPSSDDDENDDEGDSNKNEKSGKTNNNDNKEISDAEKTTTTGSPNANQNDTSNSANYITSTNGFTNTESAPCHVCSAEDDLHSTLERIRKVMEMDKSNEKGTYNYGNSNNTNNNTIDNMYSEILQGNTEPLSRQQIYELRKIIHDHSVKAQDTVRVENAETNQPRLCNHCFEVNVQAKHLCPDVVNGSVAFDETGKVINPHEGVKYGTSAKRGMDGTYRHDTERAFLNSTKSVSKPTRTNFNMQSKDKLTESEILRGVTINKGSMPPQNAGSALYKSNKSIINVNGSNGSSNFMPNTKVNDNTYSLMKTTNSVQNGIDYPGSIYNAYLSNNNNNNEGNNFTNAGATQSKNDKFIHTNDNYNANKYMSSTSNDNASKNIDDHTFSGASVDRPVKECKTSASLWRTTNQEREEHLRRFAEMQKLMQINAKKVYEASQNSTKK